MKKALVLVCFCVLSLTAKCIITDPPTSAESITLIGFLDVSAGPNDVTAYYYENAIYISFTRNFGNVSISIYNVSRMLIYNDIVNTDVEALIVIPFLNNSNGTYTLVLENTTGYAEGELNKEP